MNVMKLKDIKDYPTLFHYSYEEIMLLIGAYLMLILMIIWFFMLKRFNSQKLEL